MKTKKTTKSNMCPCTKEQLQGKNITEKNLKITNVLEDSVLNNVKFSDFDNRTLLMEENIFFLKTK